MQCEKAIIYEFHLHKDIFSISAKQSKFALFLDTSNLMKGTV